MTLLDSARRFAVCSAILSLGLMGCATLSEEECRSADWRTIGYEDGVDGRPESRIADHRKACADVGIAPDLSLYQDGRMQGLTVYCQPRRGFEEGADGNTYHGVCPPDLDYEFRAAYEDGRRLHDLTSDAEDLRDEIDDIGRDIREWRDEIDRKRDRLAAGVPADEADRLERDIRKRRRDIERARDERRSLENDLFYLEGRIDEFSGSVWW